MNRPFPILVCIAILFTFGIQADAWQTATETPTSLSGKQQAENLASFEKIWKTIRDTHWDSELVGESWEQHRQELLPKIQAATTLKEARRVMAELIDRLGQSHFAVIPASSYEVLGGEDGGGGSSDIGITLRVVEGGLVVTEVREDGPSAAAGVSPGWSVTEIRDRTAEDLLERFKKAAHGPQRFETIAGLATGRMTSGGKGEEIEITFVDGNDEVQGMTISCSQPPGTMARLGNLPSMRVTDKSLTLSDNIGYYRFNAFLDPIRIMPAYRKAIRHKNHTAGLVIDLRGNYGGIAGMTMGMAGEFVTKPTKLGTMTMKGSKLDFFANPRATPVEVPVAVLVDECSISSAEFLAGGLQDNGLARIFGSRTAGLALPSVIEKLPNGDGFQYAIANYHSANGNALEMNGVVPDQKIELKRADLLQGNDPVLDAAIEWIKSENKG